MALISAAFYGHPARKLTMIGITGTKGKTTTAFFLVGILREAGIKTGLIGTVCVEDGCTTEEADRTTPESCDIHRYLRRMADNGCKCCVMEVSSQGIKLQRVAGITFDLGIFLNISPDHIGVGEHETFSDYLHCKGRLFRQCRIGLVNADDPNADRVLMGHTCQVKYFTAKEPYVTEERNIEKLRRRGRLFASFSVCAEALTRDAREFGCNQKADTISIPLPGHFNVENAVAAIAAAAELGIDMEHIKTALLKQVVPGRFEYVGTSDKYVILVDYAHNEKSLRCLLEELRLFKPGRLIVMFGCGGNRSGLRRAHMGETAGYLADLTIITSDNPRWEDPESILDDIEAGIRHTPGRYIRITDRREAIAYAVSIAMDGDIIVLAGKGHEAYQEICGSKYPFSDISVARECIDRAASSPDILPCSVAKAAPSHMSTHPAESAAN
jgi:UDP-N-acetylmuramoyl-L-alanyl-D-glutamate--2,6-diaminopimelate ligase